jgi:hypothetical protein
LFDEGLNEIRDANADHGCTLLVFLIEIASGADLLTSAVAAGLECAAWALLDTRIVF